MTKIQLLGEKAVNQIAAGEVIESPASVVKELVENAVDAGARKIRIAIKGGGLQSIQVSDDGCGMGKEDAVRCFLRFATSKIREVDDLLALTTMGFRGEALAAIGAISKVTLRTAQEGGVGTCVELEGGNVLTVEPCAQTRGTSFEVRSLFYNVPARKKFQKAPAICAAEITRMVSLLALAHPDIAFELFQQERSLLHAPLAEDFESRVQDVLGEEFLAESICVKIEEKGLKLKGVIGHPLKSRASRTGQYLFINQRPVHSPLVSYAVKDGYGTRLAEGRHPVFALHLELDTEVLDVNVHPQKKEVRIREEVSVKEKIRRAIFQSLEGREAPFILQREEVPFLFSDLPSMSERELPFKFAERPSERAFEIETPRKARALGVVGNFLLLDLLSVPAPYGGDEEGILLFDLEAARRCLLFHSLQTPQGVASQGLILPLTVSLTKDECQRVEAHLEEVEKMGIVLRPIGQEKLLVDALPPYLPPERVQDLLSLFAEEFCIKEILEDERERRLARLCARMVHTDKKKISEEEALRLFEELLKSPSPLSCPEGKPTLARIKSDEIAKLFAPKKTP